MENNNTKIPTTIFDSNHIIELRKRSQGFSNKEDLWSWFVLRRMSIYISLLFLRMNVHPNTISWLSFIFITLSGLMLLIASPISYLFAFLSYNLGYLFDCVDGEVARLANKKSKKGYFIDLLIQGASLPVFISTLLTLLIINDALSLSFYGKIFVFIITVAIILALFIPISLQLTFAKSSLQDPLNRIRNNSSVWQVISFLLGLPGFFLTLLLIQPMEQLFSYNITSLYLLSFLVIMVFKVATRLFITLWKTDFND